MPLYKDASGQLVIADSLPPGGSSVTDPSTDADHLNLNYNNAPPVFHPIVAAADSGSPDGKQDTLVSGTNIKTVNSTSLLGSGDVAVAALGANSFSGTQNLQDNLLQRPEIKDYAETVATPSIAGGTLTLDMETGNVFNVSHNANITTLTISNPPASGKAGSLTLHITQDATGGRTLTFPSGSKFSGGTSPTLSTTANKRNKLVFDTIDGGSTWDIALVGKDFG